jgi:hypothetical protein
MPEVVFGVCVPREAPRSSKVTKWTVYSISEVVSNIRPSQLLPAKFLEPAGPLSWLATLHRFTSRSSVPRRSLHTAAYVADCNTR